MHGRNNLERAIDLLNEENRNDFRKFVNNEVSFNPHNMFICKSKKLLQSYYNEIFPWLENCEKLFGFESLKRVWNEKNIWFFSGKIYVLLVQKKCKI